MSSYVQKHSNIISREVRNIVTQRYQNVTSASNRTFWQSNSNTNHSIYVGSYGRGTAVKTGDIDILCSLPKSEFDHFNNSNGNGQSRLLQSLRNSILVSYPHSDIRADGQVVKISFSDGMKFEILPAFHQLDPWGLELSSFRYPDSNMGGKWKSTDPKAEQKAVHIKNKESNGLYQATCRHLRIIRNDHFKSFHLSGIVIDSFVYSAMQGWRFTPTGEQSKSSLGDYENVLLKYFYDHYSDALYSPGSQQKVDLNSNSEALEKVLNYLVK
ncbi:SMODS domain-containing nucleotidyltransferase [Companilactobacillus nuruki]|uniref:Nucleotidyltransferase n=1 Tax=Companilactobacillus nuruki TaxID=1993540 RepID=A0A2N7AWC2_9LACO|nr:nucleotidyltransferase domain-containing protein [Companilactobacillus nuruki]PMD73053.1 nucleotidyltransferase [Companilactobacillus nuruki]